MSWHSNLPRGTTEADIDALCESDEDREWREYLESLPPAKLRELEETDRQTAVRLMEAYWNKNGYSQ